MRKKIIIFLSVVLALGLLVVAVFFSQLIFFPAVRTFVVEKAVEQVARVPPAQTVLFQSAFGFDLPKTYLLLFLNNTELRPAGGFIGAYAVVRVRHGVPEILKIEGTEILDNYAPDAFAAPPAPLSKYLKINKWQFRDSNWSPDFPTAASTSLSFYRLEHGTEAEHIDGVIGFTPTVLEELLQIIGPVTVNGQEFTSQNFTEKLEYEVEYGYRDRGVTFKERKQTLGKLASVLLPRLVTGGFIHWPAYMSLLPRLFAEKQIVLYSAHPEVAAFLASKNWDGRLKQTRGDFVLWIDANLGALKTDAAITRSLSYEVAPFENEYIATATMRFVHTGTFDWRTTRYRDYARVFVPLGSTLLSTRGAMAGDRNPALGQVDQGIENGRQWFGAFFSLEPGRQHTLSFHYLLPSAMAQHIHRGPDYTLNIQKQIGTIAPPLTVHLDFGGKYDYATDLAEDREFTVKLGK